MNKKSGPIAENSSQLGKVKISDKLAFQCRHAIRHITEFQYWGPVTLCTAIVAVAIRGKLNTEWFVILGLLALIVVQAQYNSYRRERNRREIGDAQTIFVRHLSSLEPSLPNIDKPRLDKPRQQDD